MSTSPESQGLDPAGSNRWIPEPGHVVRLRRKGEALREGRIETVMPDWSGFWLESHGADTRIYIQLDADSPEIWVQ